MLASLLLVGTEYVFIRATGMSWWSVVVVPMSAALLVVGVRAYRTEQRYRQLLRQRDELAAQLEHRISELFTLRELGYVLSDSFQQDRIVEQVVRYLGRFIRARGVMVVLVEDDRWLRIVAAEGTLADAAGRRVPRSDVSLLTAALDRGRIEVDQRIDSADVRVLYDLLVRSAAVVPLRSRNETLGAIAVTDHADGPFTTEDLWLLSTVATSASVVLANSKLFARVEHGRLQWETAFDALREGIAVLNADGTIQRANQALATMANALTSELNGKPFAPLLFQDPAPALAYMQNVQSRGAASVPSASPGRHGGLLRLTLAPLGGAFGHGAMVALVEDVTAQRAMEAQLIQSEKMAAIGQLVSGVAHELNNPLTSIAGLAELLLEREPLPDSPRQHIRIIHDQAERAGRIVRNLLTFARKETAQQTVVDLNDVVGRTSSLVAYDLRLREIEVENHLSGHPVLVHGDPHELQQVLLNLLTNAIHALAGLPAGRQRRITLRTHQQDGDAVLEVMDSGDGVREDHRPRLFTPFFTTKPAGQGTGLGLSLSYGIAQSHGGSLSYRKAPTGGATFVLALPLAAAPHGGVPADATRHILVAGDDPGLQRMVRALFAPDGHVVHAAPEPEQLRELLNARDYDMVVADAEGRVDPETSVLELLQRVRPTWKSRMVVVGALPSETNPPRSLGKPLDIRRLRQIAEEILKTG
ncbi:MAG TPA: ATP-binding protein [Gemmatimonadales bacterium]|nr:ATP-binding protein [Gemmatimonadales bacterium]